MTYRSKLLTLFLCLFTLTVASQSFVHQRMHFKRIYTQIDSLILENAPTPFPTEEGDYLIELPKAQKIVIAYNHNKTKAIVLHGYRWAKKMEFNVKDNEVRLILWYKDEHVYCGYIYDKKSKACSYAEAINEAEKEKLVKKFPFLEWIPTFSLDNSN